jgi:hypothetical protein
MVKEKIITNGEELEYYISTKIEKNEFLIYTSEPFKLSEIDLINLIKVCLIEARNKTIGKKLLAIYRDSTTERPHITKERLELIGIKEEELPNPYKSKKPKCK